MQTNYAECERRVLLSEGGYTNDPRDPGGPTNFGITLHDARSYWKPSASAEDVRSMPRAIAEGIYKTKYWDKVGGDDLPAGVDYAVFDYAVNSGVARAMRVLDSTLAVEGRTLPQIVNAICDERMAFLRRLKAFPHFGAGWMRRVASVRAYALHLATAAQADAPEHPEAPEGSPKAYDEGSEDTPPATIPEWLLKRDPEPQKSPVVRSTDPAATQVAPTPQTQPTGSPRVWWKPWAAVGLGGGALSEWLDRLDDWLYQARDLIQHPNLVDAYHWLIQHPLFLLLPALALLGGLLWQDHKRTKALIKELECSRQSSASLPSSAAV